MIEIRLPNITAKDETGQLLQVKSYLYQMAEQLNWAMKTIESGTSVSVVDAKEKKSASEKDDPVGTFNSIKALIIKSADIVNAYSEEISKNLKGMYVAQSDFGMYSEQTDANIIANSKSITQAYENIQALKSDVANISSKMVTNAHIKSGLLYYAGDENEDSGDIPAGTPIYGLEVGQRTTDNNGVEIFRKYARFTAYKLSFYDQNNTEVAYFSNYKLYVTHVEITGSYTQGGFVKTTRDDGSVVTKWNGW